MPAPWKTPDDPGSDEERLWRDIADQVAVQRRARALSQRELAELCATTQSAIARLERGVRPPRLDTLRRIAEALDCELVVRLRPRTATGTAGSQDPPTRSTDR